ncbi:putative cytochrome P450 pisatin demethylase-like protein [Triangularia verruculosa]|uniref:Cytochrome P450 pisatin demethylase-like protein n=1 Tax=Triangularia verruculosa TaxID=2587418 RepID=A0AAN7AWZ4_9PEZI|nr:putative cytochrome P450 pisatin demethylase-like protein [Triangularia verruculosa]
MAVLSVLLGLLGSYLLGWIIYARWFHPYSKYPGPFLASISPLWVIKELWMGKIDISQRKWHEKYGPIIRIAPNEVVISDPSVIKAIYGAGTTFTKTEFYKAFGTTWARYPEHFCNIDPKTHGERRKLISHVYTMSNVARYEPAIEECIDLLAQRVKDASESGQSTDMALWLRYYAFDVIGVLFFSRPFGFLEFKRDYKGWIRATDTLIFFMAASAYVPLWMRNLVLMSSIVIPGAVASVKAMDTMTEATLDAVNERQKALEKSGGVMEKDDMLASFFRVMEKHGNLDYYGPLEIRGEIYTALMAGSDTTATAITSVLYHLMKNPRTYRKLRDEIDTAVAEGRISSSGRVKYVNSVKLPYFDACCKEGMRIHTSLGLSLPRYTPKDGVELLGRFFPGGVKVGCSMQVVQRDKGVFGEDADEFVPERWLGPNAANMQRHMLNFGGGPHMCLGMHISMMEIYKALPELIRDYDLELADPSKEWSVNNIWFYQTKDVHTNVTKRKRPVWVG